MRISYWAVFGAFNIVVDDVFYRVMDGLTLLGAGGLIVYVVRRRSAVEMPGLAFLALLFTLGAAMLMWWSTQTWASTGRLLFPYITSASVLLALGLSGAADPAAACRAAYAGIQCGGAIAYIMPNYDHPPVMEALPDSGDRGGCALGGYTAHRV